MHKASIAILVGLLGVLLVAGAASAAEPKTFRAEFQAATAAAEAKDATAYLEHMQSAMKLEHDRSGRPFYQYNLARAFALNGRTAEALATLEEAWNERIEGPMIVFADVDPAFATVRNDPRYAKVRALFDALVVEVRPAGGSVYEIIGTGCTLAASIGADGILLVDSGYPRTSSSLLRALEKQAGKAPRVRYIVNTHGHYDHAASNREVGANAIVIAHPAAATEMKSGSEFVAGFRIPAVAAGSMPDLMTAGELTIPFNGETVRVIALPSHTPGDLIVWFEGSRVLHMGDDYFGSDTARIRPGADPAAFYATLGALLKDVPDDAVVISGHAARVEAKTLKAAFSASQRIFQFVRDELAAGRTEEEILARGEEIGHPRSWLEVLLKRMKKQG